MCFFFVSDPPATILSIEFFCPSHFFWHIAAVVNRHPVKSLPVAALPVNKAIDSLCCHQFKQTDHRRWVADHQRLDTYWFQSLLHTHTLTHTHADTHAYQCGGRSRHPLVCNRLLCLTVAVVVLHYFHMTNAWTTFSLFIFKYCQDICEDFMSFLLVFFCSCCCRHCFFFFF